MTMAAWLAGDDWPADIVCGPHHIGTTRMSDDPASGVVDRNCRSHLLRDLYIAGSSVFPTGGHAPPTLTIVALAIRLAEHVRTTLNSERAMELTNDLHVPHAAVRFPREMAAKSQGLARTRF